MATTSEGLRYPAATAAPNAAQDIQNLAQDVDGKLTRFQFLSAGWPSSTLAGANGIQTNVLTVPAQSGTYAVQVSAGLQYLANASAGAGRPMLQLYKDGVLACQFTAHQITTSNIIYGAQVSRGFLISGGASSSYYARMDIPANVTLQTFTDNTHAYLTVMGVFM